MKIPCRDYHVVVMREERERIITGVLALVVFISLVGVAYIALTPRATTDPQTELYILGPDGTASGYPTNLTVEETGTVIVGITNQEQRSVTYTVLLRLDNETSASRVVTVDQGQTWEDRFSFTPESEGEKNLWIVLYKGQSPDTTRKPYRELWLFVNVTR